MRHSNYIGPLRSFAQIVCAYWMILIQLGCSTTEPLSYEVASSKTYSWQRQHFHPIISIGDRNDTSITYRFTLPPNDFISFNESELLVVISALCNDQWKSYQKKFLVPQANRFENGHFSGDFTIPVDSTCTEAKMLFKEINTIRQGEFPLHFTPLPNGPVWKNGLHQQIISQSEPLKFHGDLNLAWALRSEKLPSPPFSTTPPFVPNEVQHILKDSIQGYQNCCKGNGCYIIESSQQVQYLQVYNPTYSSEFPNILKQNDLIGPVRYLCSKDEFEKIQRSNEGAENQLEKFWITCGGGKEKARELIQLYYQRAEDANIYFTSYADGWKTDRGMIYLVFGHPIQIIEDEQQLVWYYGANNDPTTLKFIFNKEKHPIWGIVYLLQRKEEYRNAWEYQVTAWRQGKIFD